MDRMINPNSYRKYWAIWITFIQHFKNKLAYCRKMASELKPC